MTKTKPRTTKKTPETKGEAVDYSKPLKNNKYEAFCQQYMVDNNATQAGIRAGYSAKTAGSKGTQLLQIVSIQNRLTVLQGRLAEESGVSIKKITEGFKKIAFGTLCKTLSNKHRLRALENLGKHIGFYGKDNEQKQTNLADFLKAMKDG